jgi:hypothetical protein
MSKPDRFEGTPQCEHMVVDGGFAYWCVAPKGHSGGHAMGGMMDLPDRFEDEHEWARVWRKPYFDGETGKLRHPNEFERPIVWPVGAQIPIKDEEEVADADATLEARASRSNPEE